MGIFIFDVPSPLWERCKETTVHFAENLQCVKEHGHSTDHEFHLIVLKEWITGIDFAKPCSEHKMVPSCNCGKNYSCLNCGEGGGCIPCDCTPLSFL